MVLSAEPRAHAAVPSLEASSGAPERLILEIVDVDQKTACDGRGEVEKRARVFRGFMVPRKHIKAKVAKNAFFLFSDIRWFVIFTTTTMSFPRFEIS